MNRLVTPSSVVRSNSTRCVLESATAEKGLGITIADLPKVTSATTMFCGDRPEAIRAGEFVTIVGRSGCGKAHCFCSLVGLDQPTTGRFLVWCAG